MLKILLNAGKSSNLEIVYDLFLILLLIIYVKITMTWRKPAGVRSIHTSEASQRLHAGDLEKNKYNVNNYSYSLNTHHYPLSGFKQCGLLLYSGLICGPHTKSNLFTRGFSNTSDLSPYYVTGFSDGESCFHLSLLKSKGSKNLDFESFSLIQEIVNNGLHKTENGINKINMIKRKMNSKRIDEN